MKDRTGLFRLGVWSAFWLSVLLGMSSAASAQTCITPPSGLVSWWPGDGTAEDIVGPNDGTLFGNASFAPGFVDEAFSFDGNGDWVDFGSDPIYNFGSDDFTISLWVNWNTLAGPPQLLIEKWDNGPAFEGVEHAGWSLSKLAGGTIHFATGQGGASWTSVNGFPTGIAVGIWNHLAVSRESGQITTYWNSGVIATGFVASFKDTPFPLLIGRRYDSRGLFHNGLIDEVGIFNRALSASEVQAIFNSGSAGKCKADMASVTVTPGQDFYWPLDQATINLNVSGVSDLLGLGAELPYDDARLSFNDGSVAPGAFLDDGSTVEFEDDDNNGMLALSSTRTSGNGASGSGPAITMTFSVADFALPGPVSGTNTLTDLLAVNSTGAQIPFSQVGGLDGAVAVGVAGPDAADSERGAPDRRGRRPAAHRPQLRRHRPSPARPRWATRRSG